MYDNNINKNKNSTSAGILAHNILPITIYTETLQCAASYSIHSLLSSLSTMSFSLEKIFLVTTGGGESSRTGTGDGGRKAPG